MNCAERVLAAFAHREPDRTPLFEIFQPYHPVHWPVCGRTIGTDEALCWSAMADGVAWEELLEAHAQAAFRTARFFGLDMVRLNGAPPRGYERPVRTGPDSWTRGGREYRLNPRTHLVELARPGGADAYSRQQDEAAVRARIEAWDGSVPAAAAGADPLSTRVRALAAEAGLDWLFMAEIGAGTGAAFYPGFMLIWMIAEPELFGRWLEMQKAAVFPRTEAAIAAGHRVVAMGGDVSCDKGPFISPALYRAWILPAIREHVAVIHRSGALAVYTSDGNHWPIRDDFFFNSGVDGYKEVDRAAGMTMDRLIAEGVKDRVCVIGNLDARRTLCHASPAEVRAEVIECLEAGRRTPGGHILHASHSVHEDVRPENYFAAVAAYREFFGLPPLPETFPARGRPEVA